MFMLAARHPKYAFGLVLSTVTACGFGHSIYMSWKKKEPRDDSFHFKLCGLCVALLSAVLLVCYFPKPVTLHATLKGKPADGMRIGLVAPRGKRIGQSGRTDSVGSVTFNRLPEGRKYALMTEGEDKTTTAYESEVSVVHREDQPVEVVFDLPLKTFTYLGAIRFEEGRYDLDEAARASLTDTAALFLRENPDMVLCFKTHCSLTGSDAYNDWLSAKRATSIHKLLRSLGVHQNRAFSIACGKREPVVFFRTDADANYANRRACIYAMPATEKYRSVLANATNNNHPPSVADAGQLSRVTAHDVPSTSVLLAATLAPTLLCF
jgi:outer membrane protein OmpA-like peptidoglycan-associated protein